jgi:hypothetical protein
MGNEATEIEHAVQSDATGFTKPSDTRISFSILFKADHFQFDENLLCNLND